MALDPIKLNESQIEPDWDGRLAYERGRLALYTGDISTARTLLLRAEAIIGAKNPDGRVSVAAVRRLLQRAGVKE